MSNQTEAQTGSGLLPIVRSDAPVTNDFLYPVSRLFPRRPNDLTLSGQLVLPALIRLSDVQNERAVYRYNHHSVWQSQNPRF
jgi:hypothetical protein